MGVGAAGFGLLAAHTGYAGAPTGLPRPGALARRCATGGRAPVTGHRAPVTGHRCDPGRVSPRRHPPGRPGQPFLPTPAMTRRSPSVSCSAVVAVSGSKSHWTMRPLRRVW